MSDLTAIVVTIHPTESVTLPANLSRAVYAQLMRWLDDADPAITRRWHDTDGPKPFTCSNVVGARRSGPNQRLYQPDKPVWFRLTGLLPEISAALQQRVEAPPQTVELDEAQFVVDSLTLDPEVNAWTGSTSYEDLAAPYLLARQEAPRRLALSLASPTSFRRSGMNLPIPLPDLVFGGLADRWNAFSQVAISPEIRRYCESSVALNNFHLRSRALPGKDGALDIGAIGKVHFRAVRYDRYWMSLLGLLADYAFYAGVGRMTTTGLGQARRLQRQ